MPRPSRRPACVSISSSTGRRRRCAAITSGPYSTNCPDRTRSSMFSRAVRWPACCRRATASAARRRGRTRAARAPRRGRGGRGRGRPRRRAAAAVPSTSARSSKHQRVTLEHVSPAATAIARTTPPARRGDHVLHLHRFHHEQGLPRATFAFGDRDAHDRPLHRGARSRGVPRRALRPGHPCQRL